MSPILVYDWKMKRNILGLIIIVGFAFSRFPTPAYAMGLSDVESAIGIDIIYSGNEQGLTINQILPGAYAIKASAFACTPGTPNCEPDRYEIRFDEIIRPIYGLGTLVNEEKTEVSDFIDNSFSMCHYVSITQGTSDYECDNGRLRTPMLILPTKGIILAYLQPSVKILRLTRNGTNGCPPGKTCIVFKKHHLYNEGAPSPLLVIKKNNLIELYKAYSQTLKTFPSLFFRQPNYKNFGVGWETFAEVGCDATSQQLDNIVNKYFQAGINLSSLTIGSGYWNTNTVEGCGIAEANDPATDTVWAHESHFGGLAGLTNFFNSLKNKNIVPIIGMRTRIKLGQYKGQDNISRINQFFNTDGTESYFQNGYDFTYDQRTGTKAKLIRPDKLNTWLDIIKNGKSQDPNDGYGSFAGFKMDDFVPSDQRGYTNNPTAVNLQDDFFSKIHPLAYIKFGQDFLIHSREQWFSPSADANSGIMWARGINYDNYENIGYLYKFADDKALSEIISGYPHVRSAETGTIWKCTDTNGQLILNDGVAIRNYCQGDGQSSPNSIHSSQEKEFLRTNQIVTFYPVMNISTGFWRTNNSAYQNAIIFYEKMRNRLQQYAYDQAMKSFNTGVPWEMQPLFIRWYSTNSDAPEYAMYNQVLRSTSDLDQKHPNEFMFGNALLIRPLYTNSNLVNVYLPTGTWKGFIKKLGPIAGPTTISYQLETDSGNPNDYPIFLKEGEILLIADHNNLEKMQAYVFLDSLNTSNIYENYTKAGTLNKLQAFKTNGTITIKNVGTNQSVIMTDDPYGKGFKTDGHVNIYDYNLLVSKFGNPYTIFDYNDLVTNFGT